MGSEKPVVVMVDDDLEYLESLRAALTKELPDYDFRIFHDTFKAMIEIPKINPDVLVLDIFLSPYDGIQILRILRRNKIMTPAIFISGFEGIKISKRLVPGNHVHDVLVKTTAPRIIADSVSAAYRSSYLENQKEVMA